jgi:hypothetical protein
MVDWGIYALQADARSPTVIFEPDAGTYHLAFPRGIQIYGVSGSTYLGDANVAGEISLHRNTPLDVTPGLGAGSSLGSGYPGGIVDSQYPWQVVNPAQSHSNTAITRGTTVNGQISVQAQFAPNRFADGASLQVELAGNQLVSYATPPDRTRFALAVRAVLTPQYFQVVPGLDLSVPVSFGLGLVGRSSVDASQNAGAGFVSIGLNATYHVVWEVALSFTHFVGRPRIQPLADRDFATISLTRTF